MTVNNRIKALREQLALNNLAAYLIPSSDPHQSEYAAGHWKSREWISGFTGSTGLVIVTPDHAGLWTDSRYFIQANQELENSEVELHKLKVPHTPEYIDWLKDYLPPGSQIGCDGSLFSKRQIQNLTQALQEKNIRINLSLDLFSVIWADRPALPNAKAFLLEDHFSGESRALKLSRIREVMNDLGASDHLLSELGDIAWILNIRSTDIDFNPVLISYLHIGLHTAYLFVDQVKISADLKAALEKDGILLKPYQELHPFLQQLDKDTRILIDPSTTNIRTIECLKVAQTIEEANPSLLMRSIKNETEISHIKEAMIKDGIALTRLYRWIEKELKHRTLPEFEVGEQLDHFRREQGDYQGESFPAIVGYAGNGAIVHYRPTADQCSMIKQEGILLLDSGGQYLQGTTDITRTTALGVPSTEQKEHFTLVLKGHIGLAKLKFPKGTRGNQMDVLARQHLWEKGLNYGHGTGHGVGFLLNVHEGPQSINGGTSKKVSTPFQIGMLTSNEPGFYQTEEYGIRIENLILCKEYQQTEYGQFLEFQTLTLFPIDLNLIEEQLLNASEKEWLESYHQKVYTELAPRLNVEEKEWLAKQCGL